MNAKKKNKYLIIDLLGNNIHVYMRIYITSICLEA